MTTRQMIRKCGFRTDDGKNFIKNLNKSYHIKAFMLTDNGVHMIKVEKYFNNELRDQQTFFENSDFSLMQEYCERQTF